MSQLPRTPASAVLVVFSVLCSTTGCATRGTDDPGLFAGDAGTTFDAGGGGHDAGPTDPRVTPVEGEGVYDTGAPDPTPELCAPADIVPAGCVAEMSEGGVGLCNGADDDCDGEVDEDCPCTPGEVQRCFRGPPGRRGTGACQDGSQRCMAAGEFGLWAACEGGISPSAETCDSLDNDCNGCEDELEGCVPDGACPGPGDPRVPDGRPFSTYDLRGGEFYSGDDATAWRWEVVGTPCDRMFQALPGSTATSENGQLSYTLRGATTENASLDFTLSGDYEVTLTVTREDGSEFSCSWIVPVRAPGLRVELCWDATGPTADTFGGTVDLDLHLGKEGTTTEWFAEQDCDYSTCKSYSYAGGVDWGYADTPIDNCTGPGARGDFEGSCPNPRLDIDNISQNGEYVPENVNVDNPADGDRFRVMVHHYTWSDQLVHPLVNVYCGGELRGTYGAAPDLVEGFDEGGGRSEGDMWRVVDVQTAVDATGTTTGCTLDPIHPDGATSGYHVAADTVTY